MKAKEVRYYLHNLDGLKEDIRNIQESIELYRNMDIEYTITPILSHLPIHHENDSKVERCVIKRVEYIEQLQRDLMYKHMILDAITSVLNYVHTTSTEYTVMYLRYFDKQKGRSDNSFKDIAQKLNYTESRVEKIDRKIINNICNKVNKRVRF